MQLSLQRFLHKRESFYPFLVTSRVLPHRGLCQSQLKLFPTKAYTASTCGVPKSFPFRKPLLKSAPRITRVWARGLQLKRSSNILNLILLWATLYKPFL